MELYHLQTFVVVAEEASITKAAKRLYTTPSSISVHIKTLENELNVQLFTRTARGMLITEQGQILLDKAHKTLQSVNDLVNHATDMQNHLIGTVRFGINASTTLLRIPQLISALQETSDGISLVLKQMPSEQVIQAILQDDLDVGFAYAVSDETHLHAIFISNISLSLVAHKNQLPETATVTWEQLAQLPWICNVSDCAFQDMLATEFKSRGLSFEPAIETDNETSKAALVKDSIGVAMLETIEAEQLAQQNDIVIIPEHTFVCPLFLITQSHRQFDPVIAHLTDHIQTLWQGEP